MPTPPPKWHPIMAAQERDPGVWIMVDELGWEYGHIAILRRHGAVCYRVQFRPKNDDGEVVLVGYGTTLRSSCERVHGEFVKSGQPAARIGFEDAAAYAARVGA